MAGAKFIEPSPDGGNETLTWDEYFLEVAKAVSRKSKDPHCKVGSVIVNRDRVIIATGFNGIPRSINDDPELLIQKFEKLDWIIHAEHNALLNAARSGVATLGCTLYVNKFPCFSCLLAIVQAGIQRVYTFDDEYWRNDPIDSDHAGKEHIRRTCESLVDAPNLPILPPKVPELKPGLRRTKATEPAGAAPAASRSKPRK